MPDLEPGGVRLPPSREASADRHSLGDGGQPDLRRPAELIITAASATGLIVLYGLFIECTTFVFRGHTFYTLFDDAMISMQYARNLAEGHGLVWHPRDAPVEGYTNLLWTLWMALLHRTGVNEATIGLLVALSGAATIIGAALVAQAIAKRMFPEDERSPRLVLWGTLLYYPLAFWSLRGLEVGLVACLLGLCVLSTLRLQERFRRRDAIALAAFACLGVLTRMEFLIAAAVVVGFAAYAIRDRGIAVALTVTLSLAVTLALWTVLRYSYYGELLPNTYYLKVAGVALDVRVARGLESLLFVGVTHFGGLVALLCIYLVVAKPRATSPECLLVLFAASSVAYSIGVGGDAWEDFAFANRYIAPVVPMMLILCVRGCALVVAERRSGLLIAASGALLVLAVFNLYLPEGERGTPVALRVVANVAMACALLLPILFARQPRSGSRWLRLAPLAVLAVLVVALDLAPVGAWAMHGPPHSDGDAAWAAYGLTLRETTNADATVAVTWAGAVSYFSHRRTFDELGKTDAIIAHGPNVAPIFRPGHSKWNLAHSIGELQPDIIAGLFQVNERDLANIRTWGYETLSGSCFYRSDTSAVDIDNLRTALRGLEADPRFGIFTCGPLLMNPGGPGVP